jgi:hypothetical protein
VLQGFFAVYEGSKGQGSSLFANSVRPPEEIGVAQFVLGHCLPQERLGFFMAEERGKTKFRGLHWC